MIAPCWSDTTTTVYLGKAEHVLPTLADASVDAICTDPPYEIGMMGRAWDATGVAYNTAMWAECLRILRPGGHLLAFGGTRTWHRMVCAVEDAGFEIRDTVPDFTGCAAPALAWLHGQGFPKSKAHLKPAWEPIVLARRPLAGTVAANVLEHGTGALNIDGCRVQSAVLDSDRRTSVRPSGGKAVFAGGWSGELAGDRHNEAGRWPTNVVFSHLPECGPDGTTPCVEGCAVAELDRQSGIRPPGWRPGRTAKTPKFNGTTYDRGRIYDGRVDAEPRKMEGEGGASRFYPVFRYQAKAPASERPRVDGVAHETVKPLALIRWLTRLITPPGGTVLDMFLGSGTTAEACALEGFRCVGIEREAKYLPLISARLTKPMQPGLGFDDLEAS